MLTRIYNLILTVLKIPPKQKLSMSDYIKTEEDVLKLHEATDKVTKNRQFQTVEFSNGKVITFSRVDLRL